MLSERDRRAAFGYYGAGGDVYLMNLELGAIMPLEGWLNETLGDEFRFIIDTVEPEPLDFPEQHTDEEFEALFEEVPPEALEEAKEHLSSITKEKRTRAENRHMIEHLAKEHPELSVAEIAARVGVSTATVRKHIK